MNAIHSLTAAPRLKTVYDFGGFDPVLYAIRYEPSGAVEVGTHVRALLESARFAPRTDPAREIDHG